MALVNVALCKELYEDYAEVLDGIFDIVEAADSTKESDEPACMAYEHYQSIFDEIFLSVEERYGRTPNMRLQCQTINFGGPFTDPETGRILGIYENSSSAGVDVINLRRERKGIKDRVRTLRGSTYWVNEEGSSLKELMEKY